MNRIGGNEVCHTHHHSEAHAHTHTPPLTSGSSSPCLTSFLVPIPPSYCHACTDRQSFNILVWSRLGFDRPCAATVAYLLRKWGMSLAYALDVVSVARIGTNISAHYMEALEVYALRHSLGDMLCTECTVTGLTKDER
jgi:hypothetical protein